MQIIASSLLAAERDLAIASFALARLVYQVNDSDFFGAPGMRKYGVGRDLVLAELPPGEVAVFV